MKERLAAALEEHLGAARRRYEALMADPVRIDHVLAAGAERARARASAVLARVRRVRGLAG